MTSGGTSQSSGETNRFSDGNITFDTILGGSDNLDFFFDDTSSLIQYTINITHNIGRSGDFTEEHRFQQFRLSG